MKFLKNLFKKEKMFHLVDYKGKFDIACDELDEGWDYKVGEISKEDLIDEASERKSAASYYGVPAYIGKDKDLKKLFDGGHKY